MESGQENCRHFLIKETVYVLKNISFIEQSNSFKSWNLSETPVGVGVGYILSIPIPTPGKTADSDRLRIQLWLRL